MISFARRRRSLSIRATIALVAMVPIASLALFTARIVDDANTDRQRASEVHELSTNLATLASVRTDLRVESYWAGAIGLVGGFGVPDDMLVDMIGVDLKAEFGAAAIDTDRLLPELSGAIATVQTDLTDLRSIVEGEAPDGEAILAGYEQLDQRLSRAIQADLDGLVDVANTMAARDAVIATTTGLGLAVNLSNEMSTMASTLFATRFPAESGWAFPAGELYATRAAYEDTIQAAQAATIGRTRDAIDRFATAPAVQQLVADVDEQLELEASGGSTTGFSLDLEVQLAAFEAAVGSLRASASLVETASANLDADATTLVDQAGSDRQSAIAIAVAITLGTLSIAVLTSRWIIRPLRDVADAAARMMEGHLEHTGRMRGPTEIREAAQALNEAAQQLELAERQARALASEELDDPSLAVPASGTLGAALQSAIGHLQSSIEKREQFRQRLSHEASHDGLTGLPNRNAVTSALEQALARADRAGSKVAVLFIDLDRFKRINDLQGHAAGDRVLRTVAQRLTNSTRAGDHVGRMGGDEFIVVAEPVQDIHDALRAAQRIRDGVEQPLEYGSVTVTPALSIGIAISNGAELTADELLRDADLAVYQAKNASSSGIEVCDVGLRSQLTWRYQIEARLSEALVNDELMLHYQPIVAADDGRLVAVEALLRWPTDGGLPPGEFIPIAERSDLIIDVDRWVIEHAIHQLATWRDHPAMAPISVSINISAKHLAAGGLAHRICSALDQHDVAGERLIIEITESAIVDDLDTAVIELSRIRDRGVKVAMDDFGTGYASLTHLRQLPLDILKLDRTFVGEAEATGDTALLQLIVETGHLLGTTVVAEGVETREQAHRLIALGCDRIQGFGFGHPMPPDDVAIHGLQPAESV